MRCSVPGTPQNLRSPLQPLGTGSPGDLSAQTHLHQSPDSPYLPAPVREVSLQCPCLSRPWVPMPPTNPRALTPVHAMQAPFAYAPESCFLQTTSGPGNAPEPSPVGEPLSLGEGTPPKFILSWVVSLSPEVLCRALSHLPVPLSTELNN